MLALLVNDLATLVQRNAGGVFDAGTTVGANEAIFLQLTIDRFGDHTAHLILTALAVRRGDDQKILVLGATGLFRLR
jgi:hypothetical protein